MMLQATRRLAWRERPDDTPNLFFGEALLEMPEIDVGQA
jgi:hypothetical protein